MSELLSFSSFKIEDYNFGGSTGELFFYCNRTWSDDFGETHIGSEIYSGQPYQRCPFTVSGFTALVASFLTPVTPNGVVVSCTIADNLGRERDLLFENAQFLDTPNPVTKLEFDAQNAARTVNLDDTKFYNRGQVDNLLDQFQGSVLPASTVILGSVVTDVDPVNPALPEVIGRNSRRVTEMYNVKATAIGAVGNGIADDYGVLNALFNVTLQITGAGGDVYMPAGDYSIQSNMTIPANVRLNFDPRARLKPASGVTITDLSDRTGWDASQKFTNALSGQGSISTKGNSLTLDPRWWGAAFDDATDDAPAINAAIVSLGSTAAMRGGPFLYIAGPAAIGSTILINRKSLVFSGVNWGRQGQTGPQSYLRWTGSAGTPMLRLQNVQGVTVKDLRLIGKASAKPSCAISLYEELFFGNMNQIQNVAIGDLADSTTIGTGFTSGVLWEGALGNNAEWQMTDISIQGCSSYGIRQNSVQNVNCRIDGFQVSACGVGVYATGAITGENWNFSGNGVDVQFPTQDDTPQNASPRVTVDSFYSELSARLWDVGGSGKLSFNGGQFQVGSFTAADGKIVRNNNEGNPSIRLTDFTFPEVSSPATAPFFEMLSPAGEHSLKTIILDGIEDWIAGGPDGTGLSIASSGTLDQRYVYFRSSAVDEGGGGNRPPNEARIWIYGDFFGGEKFEFNRYDIPTRLRLIPERFGQDITLAANTILHDYAQKIISNTTGGSITLTSTPTIADGANGEVMTLTNTGTQSIVLQDQGTLPSSNLRLKTSTVILAPRDSIQLTYLALAGDWVQTGSELAVPNIGAATGTSLAATGAIRSSGTAGVGYAAGAGGTVTQSTNKATAVTLNKITGLITLNAAALAAATIVSFVLNDSTIAATDQIIVTHESGGTPGAYTFNGRATGAGTGAIDIRNNTAGSLSEAIVLRFTVIKSVSA